jgi:hypothetical protein
MYIYNQLLLLYPAAVVLCLCAGSGKTHIAARIMQLHYLPQLQAAKARGEPFKALVFLAPTNPLVAQVQTGQDGSTAWSAGSSASVPLHEAAAAAAAAAASSCHCSLPLQPAMVKVLGARPVSFCPSIARLTRSGPKLCCAAFPCCCRAAMHGAA